MQHLDHDRLVFLALGESGAEDGEAAHLEGCDHCRTELENLQHVAGIGAETQGLGDLPEPPEHVWQGIMAEIRAAEELPSLTERRGQQAPDGSPTQVAVPARPRQRGRWSRWAVTAVTAAAAAAVGGRHGRRAAVDRHRQARAVAGGAGQRAAVGVRVDAEGRQRRRAGAGRQPVAPARRESPEGSGYYQVWLIDPGTMKMFPVGTLNRDSGDELLPIPPNVDIRTYSVVDVSAEQYDNQPAHSGDSLLRGTLTG
ncbi:anti-sigma factor [Micromonospora sp. R77]|uniref:anti-sigma factor n=1 Tax=Micromonospora sp. R77 TaxID=2925836 RepID=UPI001F6189FD|nr:anti-sigma factor [Micromonospora sp. R77]MCI4064645.1 anti-sigma factor [Micromonospora sp. R77]